MIGSYARRMWDHDYPWGPTPEERDRFCQTIIDEWGGPVGLEERAPSVAGDPAFREWWASYLRMGASPGAAVALTRMNAEIDIRDVLPSIRVPTLVLHRTGDRCLKVEEGRYLASRIPGRHLRRAAGRRSPAVRRRSGCDAGCGRRLPVPWPSSRGTDVVAGDGGRGGGEGVRAGAGSDPADLRSGMPVFPRAFAVVGRESAGRVIRWPGRAVQCALSVVGIARQSRIDARAGVHIGAFDAAQAR